VGGDPAAAVHVGDDPVLDVRGARAAGMRVVQVTSSRRRMAGERPDQIITRLAELPDAIERLDA
jgi:FMN phosphatase YigB (HAD superfamily)